MNKPSIWNKYWIRNESLYVPDIEATEYTIILGSTLCSFRYKDDKIIEMYFYDRTPEQKILAVDLDSFNKYKIVDGKIIRDDGAIYTYEYNGLTREGDNRKYYAQSIDVMNLDNRVYTAYYFMMNNEYLKDYKNMFNYDIDLLNIEGIRKLINIINNYNSLDKCKYVKEHLFIREEDKDKK